MSSIIRPIAIYLPQYHPIPENDKAWGEGFTEWTNVKKAKPLFEEHYQPHVPHEDIGYYDLRNPNVLIKQAQIAEQYGIYGFAFYHYWFNGQLLLNTPLENMLKLKEPNFPFLYIWANENWTKRWDGRDNEIIIKQNFSLEDDLKHIKYLCENVFCDSRYIRIDNKPVFAIYRTELFPDIAVTAKVWKEKVKEYGFDDLYLVRVENFIKNINPEDIGFDAAMEFAPNFHLHQAKLPSNSNLQLFDYKEVVKRQLVDTVQSYPRYKTIFPIWDNTARKKENGTVYLNTSLEAFRLSLRETIKYTKHNFKENQQYLFINAWNEWAEGCHIEPDMIHGYSFLETIQEEVRSNVSQEKEIQYTKFLQENLMQNVKELSCREKELVNALYEISTLQNIYSSRAYVLTEKLLDIYRKIKKTLRL